MDHDDRAYGLGGVMPGRQAEDHIKRRVAAAGAAMVGDIGLSHPDSEAGGRRDGTSQAQAALEACLSRIDPKVARSFSDEQLHALEVMLELRGATRHKVEFRRGFSWGSGRYYVCFFFGRDQRNLVRRTDRTRTAGEDSAGSSLGRMGLPVLTLCLALGLLYALTVLAGADLVGSDLLERLSR